MYSAQLNLSPYFFLTTTNQPSAIAATTIGVCFGNLGPDPSGSCSLLKKEKRNIKYRCFCATSALQSAEACKKHHVQKRQSLWNVPSQNRTRATHPPMVPRPRTACQEFLPNPRIGKASSRWRVLVLVLVLVLMHAQVPLAIYPPLAELDPVSCVQSLPRMAAMVQEREKLNQINKGSSGEVSGACGAGTGEGGRGRQRAQADNRPPTRQVRHLTRTSPPRPVAGGPRHGRPDGSSARSPSRPWHRLHRARRACKCNYLHRGRAAAATEAATRVRPQHEALAPREAQRLTIR